MYNLVLKDILIQKKSFLFAAFYSIFVLMTFSRSFGDAVYIMGASAIAYMFILSANTTDDKNKTEIILNSLPIRKKDIVTAKYISVIVFIVIGLGSMGLTGALMKLINLPFAIRYLNLVDVGAVCLSLALLVSIYYPLYFKFGPNFIRFINIVLFMLAFFLPSVLIGYIRKNGDTIIMRTLKMFIETLSYQGFIALIALVVLVVILVSYLISQRIYQNKDF